MADVSGDALTYISAVAAVVSMFTAVISAISASKSGRLAEEAMRANDLMSVFTTSQEIISERENIRRASLELRQQYTTLAAFSGNLQSSRFNMVKNLAEEKLSSATSLSGKAENVVETWHLKKHLSPKSIQELMFDIKADLIKIREVRAAIEDELSSTRENVAQSRSRSAHG